MSRRREVITVVGIILVSLLLSFFSLDNGHEWGDDYSVYLAQGIALSEGRLDELLVDRGTITFADRSGIIAWGYSLMLVPVHRLVGFDRVNYSSIIFYKVPAMLCLAAWGAVLYLFFRRRFSPLIAVVLSLGMSCNVLLVKDTNRILTDIPFTLFSWIALLMMDVFLHPEKGQSLRRKLLLSLAIGISVFVASIVRYAGYFLMAILFLSQLQRLVIQRKQLVTMQRKSQRAAIHLVPYFVFAALFVGVSFLMPYPRTQAGDIGQITMNRLIYNMGFYGYLYVRFIRSFVPLGMHMPFVLRLVVAAPPAVLMLYGIIKRWKREWMPLTYMLGTLGTLLMMPYEQDFRYVFNIMPCFLLFSAHGLQHVVRQIRPRIRVATRPLAILFCLGFVLNSAMYAYNNMLNSRQKHDGAYTPDAIAVYHYIMDELTDREHVLFSKPNALSLNTDKISHAAIKLALSHDEYDYYLLTTTDPEISFYNNRNMKQVKESDYVAELVFEENSMTLYRLAQGETE